MLFSKRFFAAALALAALTTASAQEIRLRGRPNATPGNPVPTFSTIDDDNGQDINDSPRTANGTLFGNVRRGESVTHRFLIQNQDNNDTLTITGIEVDSSQYSVSGLPAFPFTLQDRNGSDSDEEEFTITYTPRVFGNRTLRIRLFSNDPNEGTTTFRVRGTGVGPDMQIFGNEPTFNLEIGDGDSTPRTADGTDFGPAIEANGNEKIDREFLIVNTRGNRTLNLSNPRILPAGAPFSFRGVLGFLGVEGIDDGDDRDFTITFDPDTAGTFEATFLVDTNDERPGRGTQSFDIVARAFGTPNIAVEGFGNLSFSDIDDGATSASDTRNGNGTEFGNVRIGESDTGRFRITNEGNDTLDITSATSSNSNEFIISGVTGSLPGGVDARDEFNIRFEPAQNGLRSSIITIQSNDPDSEATYTFRVQGTGTGMPDIILEGSRPNNPLDPWATIDNGESPPTTIAAQFGEITLGKGGSIANAFRIRNRGDAELQVQSVESSQPAIFQITNVMPTPYALGSRSNNNEDIFNIRFVPQGVGIRSATITVRSTDPDTPVYTFAVNGIGLSPEMQIFGGAGFSNEIADGDSSPRQADGTDFGPAIDAGESEPRTFLIRNNRGNARLNLSNPRILPAGAPFDFRGVLGVGGIANGGDRDFTITFEPETAGTFTAEFLVDTNDCRTGRGTQSFTIVARARGIPNINVEGRGNLSFSDIDDGATSTGDPRTGNGTDFGNTDLASTDTNRFRITNEGTDTLTISSVSSSNPEFVVDSSIDDIPGGNDGSREFTIGFTPVNPGLRSSIITIESNDPDSESTYTFRVEGNGNGPVIEVFGGISGDVPIADGDTTPGAGDFTLFGIVPVAGGSNTRRFRITNTGNERLNIRNASNGTGFTGPGAASFRLENLETNGVFPELAPGESDVFDILFNPTTTGTINATLNLVNNTPGATQTYSFAVRGTGADPDSTPTIEVRGGIPPRVIQSGDTTPSFLQGTEFGIVLPADGPVQRVYRISNQDGRAELAVNSIRILQVGETFSLGSPIPAAIPPMENATFTITFDPDTDPGVKNAVVNISTNDPDTPNYTFDIRATVDEEPEGETTGVTGVAQDGDDLVITVEAPAGTTFRITTSTDLTTWTPVPGQTGLTSGTIRLSDVLGAAQTAGSPRRFYRIEEEN